MLVFMANDNSSGGFLPTLPRISVGSSSRARLAHRRPISIPLPPKLSQTSDSDGEKLGILNSLLERVSPDSNSAEPFQPSLASQASSTLDSGSDLAKTGEKPCSSSACTSATPSLELIGNAPAASLKEECLEITSRSPSPHPRPSPLPGPAKTLDNCSNDCEGNPNLISSESLRSDCAGKGDSQTGGAIGLQETGSVPKEVDGKKEYSSEKVERANLLGEDGAVSVKSDGEIEISPQRQSLGTDLLGNCTAVLKQNTSPSFQKHQVLAEEADRSKNPEQASEESEPEEGQLPGEWSGTDDSDEEERNRTSDDEPEGCNTFPLVGEKGLSVAHIARLRETQLQSRNNFSFSSCTAAEAAGRSSRKTEMGEKKRKKHKKGQGAKKRAREKSAQKYKDKKKQRLNANVAEQHGESPSVTRLAKGEQPEFQNSKRKSVETEKQVPSGEEKSTPKMEAVEEGEITEETETGTGLLSSFVEDEVGLWTIDAVDDQLVAEMEKDVPVKKRGPETAERKLKRKIAKRKKRAQKEKELGIRKRRPRDNLSKPPPKVLCTHFMKGRCAKGDSCPFSHDAVPLTKQEPCKFLMSRSCLKGDDCPFSHDLKSFPCKFFHTRGLCYDGDKCLFSHGPITQEERDKLQKRVEKDKERGISATALDLPPPSFSSALPEEEDPDPLGWGTGNAYPSFELDYNPDGRNPEEMDAIPSYSVQADYDNISRTSYPDRRNEMSSYSTAPEEANLRNNADDYRTGDETEESLGHVDIESRNLQDARVPAAVTDTSVESAGSSVTLPAPILQTERGSLLRKRGLELKKTMPILAQAAGSRKVSVESLFGEILKQ
ncbi:hypothetical protein R1sor_009516 [Riccia sorocarpa]|uniref:C3H1-type domain-containing protein n=1 Tax=Riccia sorocarpa TaxID=122646 RepID=A0ABD3HYU5_9MARC